MVVIAFVSFIGLSVLGVPLPFVNAALAGLLEFIPNVGPVLSVVPPMLLALLDAPWKAGAVLLLYIAIQQFESLVLVPLIMKQEVDLMPVFTILAVVVFASFFGFLGLFRYSTIDCDPDLLERNFGQRYTQQMAARGKR